jgi:hypothetical protein
MNFNGVKTNLMKGDKAIMNRKLKTLHFTREGQTMEFDIPKFGEEDVINTVKSKKIYVFDAITGIERELGIILSVMNLSARRGLGGTNPDEEVWQIF